MLILYSQLPECSSNVQIACAASSSKDFTLATFVAIFFLCMMDVNEWVHLNIRNSSTNIHNSSTRLHSSEEEIRIRNRSVNKLEIAVKCKRAF
jgi:hypothetical protein